LSKLKLNVQDAAEVLGISVDAVRMRARRGSLESVHENGRLYVWLDNDETGVNGAAERVRERVQNIVERELIEDLREQVSFLRAQLQEEREENRRKDHLLAAALERIPAIEAPPEATGGPETASEEPYSTHTPPEPPEAYGPPEQRKRSWWREFLGME
jgi:hypothetical protein